MIDPQRLRAALRDIEEHPPSRPVIRLDDFERPSDIADATLAALASRNILHRRGGHVVAVRGWSRTKRPNERRRSGRQGAPASGHS